ncbi:MAG: hypothetical protein AB1Z98_13090 [Nannocystaceae bacterium]
MNDHKRTPVPKTKSPPDDKPADDDTNRRLDALLERYTPEVDPEVVANVRDRLLGGRERGGQ